MYRGGDALSVCFNTVAVLFLCEVDNVAFAVGLSERVRTRVETAGHVELDDSEASTLARTKLVHASLIVIGVIAAVGSKAGINASFLPLIPFWVGEAVELIVPGESLRWNCGRVGKVTAAFVLGNVGIFTLAMLASSQ